MDVSVEHRDGVEAREGAPDALAPSSVVQPQADRVRRGARGRKPRPAVDFGAAQISFGEVELIVAELTHLLEIEDVDERDVMDAAGSQENHPLFRSWAAKIEKKRAAPPASASCSPGSTTTGARSVPQQLFCEIELLGFGEMRDVARVHDELRLIGECVDRGDRLGEGAGDIGIGGLLETDVAIANLHEIRARGRAAGGRARSRARSAHKRCRPRSRRRARENRRASRLG